MKKIVYLTVIFFSILIFTSCDEVSQTTTTNTEENTTTTNSVEIQLNSEFETTYEVGSDEPDWFDGVLSDGVSVDASNVDMNTVGYFDVIYMLDDGSKSVQINIVDTTVPIINGPNQIDLDFGSIIDWLSPFSVTDNYDQNLELTLDNIDLSSFDQYKMGEYEVTYSIEDSNGNIGHKTVMVHLTNNGNFPDDYSNTKNNAKPIEIDSSIEGKIDYYYDVDTFEITILEEGRYVFYTESDIRTVGSLFDESYTRITSDYQSGDDNDFIVAAELQPGVYYLSVSRMGHLDGEYTLNSSSIKPYFADVSFDLEIHKQLQVYDRDFTSEELLSIKNLRLHDKNINSIEGIEELTNLEYLYLENNPIGDLTPLIELEHLKTVYLEGTNIEAPIGSDNYNVIQHLYQNGVECDIYNGIIEDDYSDTEGSSSEVEVNSIINGTIDYKYDEDWVYFTVEEQTLLSITLLSEGIRVFIGYENGTIVLSDSLPIRKEVLEPGTYYIKIIDKNNVPPATFESNEYQIQLNGNPAQSTTITFNDENLEQVVRSAIDKQEGDLFVSDIVELYNLDASNAQIADLTGIESLIYLTSLDLRNNQITDLTGVESLIYLHFLDLRDNQISNIGPLTSLLRLEEVSVENNPIDFTPGGLNDGVLNHFIGYKIWCDMNSINTEDDYGDSKEDAATIPLNSITSGSFEMVGDIDYFTFTIDEAMRIRFGVNYSSYNEAVFHSHMQLYDQDNNLIDENFLTGMSVELEPGTYYLRLCNKIRMNHLYYKIGIETYPLT